MFMLSGCQRNRSLKVPSEGNLSKAARFREILGFRYCDFILRGKKIPFCDLANSYDGMEWVHTPVNDCCLDFGKG